MTSPPKKTAQTNKTIYPNPADSIDIPTDNIPALNPYPDSNENQAKPNASDFEVNSSNDTAHVPAEKPAEPVDDPPITGEYLHEIPNPIMPIYIVNNNPEEDQEFPHTAEH